MPTVQPSSLSLAGPKITANPEASICKAVPNKINELQTSLNTCRSVEETKRIGNVIHSMSHLKEDFEQLTASYNDLILTGDKLLGQGSEGQLIEEVVARNGEMKDKIEQLEEEIKKDDSTAERLNRDFIEDATSIASPLPNKRLHVIEDYTVAVLSTAYIFMALSITYLYVKTNDYVPKSIVIGITSTCLVTVVLYSLINLLL